MCCANRVEGLVPTRTFTVLFRTSHPLPLPWLHTKWFRHHLSCTCVRQYQLVTRVVVLLR